MKGLLTVIAVLCSGFLGGCSLCQKSTLTKMGQLQQQLEDDLAKLPANRAAVQPHLAQLAGEAQREAQREQEPQNKVALYRIAALAAWQAGPAGENDVRGIVAAGTAACAALPPAQQRPTDCAIIRLAQPFAIADAFRLRLVALTETLAQLEAAHAARCAALAGVPQADCQAEVVALPASDRPEVLQVFSGFESELKDARDVVHGMGSVGSGLAEAAKNGETIIYCNAEKTWLIAKRVEGMQPDREALTCRRKRLDCLLTHRDAECAAPCPSDADNPVVDCPAFAGRALTVPDMRGDALP